MNSDLLADFEEELLTLTLDILHLQQALLASRIAAVYLNPPLLVLFSNIHQSDIRKFRQVIL